MSTLSVLAHECKLGHQIAKITRYLVAKILVIVTMTCLEYSVSQQRSKFTSLLYLSKKKSVFISNEVIFL